MLRVVCGGERTSTELYVEVRDEVTDEWSTSLVASGPPCNYNYALFMVLIQFFVCASYRYACSMQCVLTDEKRRLVSVDPGEHAESLVELPPTEQFLGKIGQHAPIVLLPLFIPVIPGKRCVGLNIRRPRKCANIGLGKTGKNR